MIGFRSLFCRKRYLPAYKIGVVCLALMSACALSSSEAAGHDAPMPPMSAQGSVQAAFAPWDDVELLLVRLIDQAGSQVLMQAYLLTSKKIATALIAAHARGVDVQVLADETQSHVDSAKLAMLASAGVPVWMETKYQNAHNKVIIIDPATVAPVLVTGSFNFTWAAQHKNAENVLVLRNNAELTNRYLANWQRHRLDAIVYRPESNR